MSDISDPTVQPSSLAHCVGQDEVKAAIDVALTYAFSENKPFPSPTLLLGPSSAGKTTFANVIAQEMCAEFTEVLAQTLTSAAELNAILLAAKEKQVIFLDEAHLLNKPLQTLLFSVIDKNTIFVNTGGRSPQPIKLPPLTILLASTDPHSLLIALKNRAKVELNFRYYTEPELAQVVHRRSTALAWDLHEAVLPLIAGRSKNEPRQALRILQSCRRVAVATGANTIKPTHLETACRLDQIDELGLNLFEQKTLNCLIEGSARLNQIASSLAMPTRTVQVAEATLMRLGLMGKDRSGLRELTPKGREHVLKSCAVTA